MVESSDKQDSMPTIDRKCPHCNKDYQADPKRLAHGRQLFCCRACAMADKRDEAKTVQGPCVVCGAPVQKYASRSAKSKATGLLCSPACHYKARSLGHSKRVVTKPYTVSEAGRAAQVSASRAGTAKRKAAGLCGHTEATKERISAALRNKHRASVGYKPRPPATGRKRSQGQSDETKRKLSEAQVRNMASGKVSRISQLERDVGAVLIALGHKVQAQFPVRGSSGRYIACCDFYLPDLNLVVEVNGTYWHADPRVYPNGPVSASQKKTCAQYAVKMVALAALGIHVAEVWEMDFKADSVGATKNALVGRIGA